MRRFLIGILFLSFWHGVYCADQTDQGKGKQPARRVARPQRAAADDNGAGVDDGAGVFGGEFRARQLTAPPAHGAPRNGDAVQAAPAAVVAATPRSSSPIDLSVIARMDGLAGEGALAAEPEPVSTRVAKKTVRTGDPRLQAHAVFEHRRTLGLEDDWESVWSAIEASAPHEGNIQFNQANDGTVPVDAQTPLDDATRASVIAAVQAQLSEPGWVKPTNYGVLRASQQTEPAADDCVGQPPIASHRLAIQKQAEQSRPELSVRERAMQGVSRQPPPLIPVAPPPALVKSHKAAPETVAASLARMLSSLSTQQGLWDRRIADTLRVFKILESNMPVSSPHAALQQIGPTRFRGIVKDAQDKKDLLRAFNNFPRISALLDEAIPDDSFEPTS